MKTVLTILCFWLAVADAEIELLIVGDQQNPVKFVVLPFSYIGTGISPAVSIENHIIQALSSTGLFSMPYRYDQPEDVGNMLAWQMSGIRYVLQGELLEARESLSLQLNIYDTLGLKPTASQVLLNTHQITLGSQMFADQVYRSLFYATFTNDPDKQYLSNENPTLTRYLNQLVVTFKLAWINHQNDGTCSVDIQQMPGGVPFKSELNEDCFVDSQLAQEIQETLDGVERLPYDQYQDVFEKNLKLRFITINRTY